MKNHYIAFTFDFTSFPSQKQASREYMLTEQAEQRKCFVQSSI